MAKKTKQLSGGARLILSGRIPFTVGVFPDQAEAIRKAAAADGRTPSQFLRHHGVMAAEKILKKISDSY